MGFQGTEPIAASLELAANVRHHKTARMKMDQNQLYTIAPVKASGPIKIKPEFIRLPKIAYRLREREPIIPLAGVDGQNVLADGTNVGGRVG